jgi:hypothetical protein
MSAERPKAWEAYEELTRVLLEKWSAEFGLGLEIVEGKQNLVGQSGTVWEIDAKGVRDDDGAIVVVECKRYTKSRVDQATVAKLAYSISDIGASGGILVTPIGVQKGGQLIAKAEDIKIIHVDANSDATSYIMKFLGNIVIGPAPATVSSRCPSPTVTITPAERGRPDE